MFDRLAQHKEILGLKVLHIKKKLDGKGFKKLSGNEQPLIINHENKTITFRFKRGPLKLGKSTPEHFLQVFLLLRKNECDIVDFGQEIKMVELVLDSMLAKKEKKIQVLKERTEENLKKKAEKAKLEAKTKMPKKVVANKKVVAKKVKS